MSAIVSSVFRELHVKRVPVQESSHQLPATKDTIAQVLKAFLLQPTLRILMLLVGVPTIPFLDWLLGNPSFLVQLEPMVHLQAQYLLEIVKLVQREAIV